MSTTAYTLLIMVLVVLGWLAAMYLVIRLFIMAIMWLLADSDWQRDEDGELNRNIPER